MLRSVRSAFFLPAALIVSACDSTADTVVEPLENAAPIAVSLQTEYPTPPAKPSLSVEGAPGAIMVTWELVSAPCLIATASAAQAGSVIELKILRAANPAANCAPGEVAYRYLARIETPAAGRYDVRVVDTLYGQPRRPLGRRTLTVPAAAIR